MSKRSWKDLTPGRQRAVIVVGVVEVIVTALAARDLARRPSSQVRELKPVWAALFVVQPFGPLAYLALGRRSGD